MRLSEAIMLGSTLSKQGFGVIVDADGNRCAYGAALQAVGKSIPQLFTSWPWLNGGPMDCPECGQSTAKYAVVSTHLNDKHKWTRERIAEWVATVEPAEETCPETVQPDLVPTFA